MTNSFDFSQTSNSIRQVYVSSNTQFLKTFSDTYKYERLGGYKIMLTLFGENEIYFF